MKKNYTEKVNLTGKIPPNNIEIEEYILGAMINHKSAALRMCTRLQPEYFYKKAHQLIFKAISKLIDKGRGAVDFLTVQDQLKKMDDLEAVGGALYLMKLMDKVANDANIDIHSLLLIDEYRKRKMIEIGLNMADEGFDNSKDPVDISEKFTKGMNQIFDVTDLHKNSFYEALNSTVLDIQNKAKGETTAYLKTGDPGIDREVSLRRGFVCVLAGAEGSGKTKYITHLAKNMLDIPENALSILWFSMEDDRRQIIRSLLSMETRLTTKQMQSINYKLSSDDIEKIDEATHSFSEYDIQFIDRMTTIHQIISQSKRFVDERSTRIPMIIIDNLGLIETDPGFSGIERDDYLVGKIKDLATELDACIILVHHFNKEASRKLNRNEGYRPRKEHIKGSTRILDYVHQALLINLPRKYSDLVYEEKESQIRMPNIEKMTKENFYEYFWSINPKGDKFTSSLSNVAEATWNELVSTIRTKKTIKEKPLTARFILQKYIEYVNYINDLNSDRKKEFHTKKMSIYQFLKKNKFNESYAPGKDSKSYYLYGNNSDLKSKIEELFIVEAAKNRDGGTSDDQVLFRYTADLGYNIFKEIINSKKNKNGTNKKITS